MLVKYLRDEDRNPFGVVVATGPGHVGLSVCSPKDRFNKKIGIGIARQRASSVKPVNVQFVDGRHGVDLGREFLHMVQRSYNYFKNLQKMELTTT